MSARWIENRKNGMARIEPRLAVVEPTDRYLFIAGVMFASCGFFVVGVMPLEVLGIVAGICFVGDLLIALKGAFSSAVRPSAQVTELASLRHR